MTKPCALTPTCTYWEGHKGECDRPNPMMTVTLRASLVSFYLDTLPTRPGPFAGVELKRALENAVPLLPRHLCTLCQSELGEKYHQDVPVVVPGNPPGNRVDLCLECHKTTMEKIDAVRS